MSTPIEKIFEDVQLHVNFTQASSRSNIVTYDSTASEPENISTAFGKLSKWYEALVPTGGSSGKILAWNSSGTAKWSDPLHPTITLSADTTSTPAQLSHGGTFTAITSVTREGNGHVTKINTATYTLPAQYVHPTYIDKTTADFYKIKITNGHISEATAIASADVSTFLNLLGTGSSTPVDNDYYISQYVNGGTTTTSYHRRPMSALWSYIKGKGDNEYAPKSHSHAYTVPAGITIKTGSSDQSHITLQTLMTWLITTKGYITSNTARSLTLYTSWSCAGNDILQLTIDGTAYELQLAGVIIEFDGYATDYQTGTFRLRIHSSPTVSFTPTSGYTQFPASHIAEYTCNGSGYSPTWKMLVDKGDTVTRTGGGASGTWGISITGNADTATTATKLGTANKGSATKGIYLNAGSPAEMTYSLSSTVNAGTANQLAYYSGANAVSATHNGTNTGDSLYFKTGTNGKSARQIILGVYGQTYGNDASLLISGTAGVMSYGDGGPQIDFNTSSTGSQAGALIFTDHDSAAAGASWHFVSNQTDWNVTSKRFHARTSISIGTATPNTSYNLYVNGTTNITGNTTIGGTLGVTGAITQNGNQVLHVGNYTSYTVTKTGSGASGTWGINITGNAATSTSTSALSKIDGYGTGTLTYHQADDDFGGTDGRGGNSGTSYWAHYIVANHGDGASYYHYTLRLPFWGTPQYQRQTGSTSSRTKWMNFLTEETGAYTQNYCAYPADGYYSAGADNITGALVITLPIGMVSIMVAFTVEIFNYATGTSCMYKISGYPYNVDSKWYNVTATCIANGGYEHSNVRAKNLKVRFGHNGTKAQVQIGEATGGSDVVTKWHWQGIQIKDILFTHNTSTTISKGWSISFETTDISNISATIDSDHVATYANAIKPYAGNELNFAGLGTYDSLWFGYRTLDPSGVRSQGATIKSYHFGNGNGQATATLTCGGMTSSGDIYFSNSGTTTRQLRGMVGDSDYWRIAGGATAANSGWMEIATADDGNEPIYVRQYTGVYTTVTRTATLLDASGNTSFPGALSTTKTLSAAGTSTADTASTSLYTTGAIEVRESGRNTTNVSDFKCAPRIGFHWSGRTAATLSYHSDGIFYFRKQDGTTRASIDANVVGSLTGNASTATKATQDGDGNTISSTYLKLSGGTMTGTLTAKASQYGDEYGGALNMNNSNIYGVNAIYTADVSDNAAEGIHFYRDSTHVDTLWMNGGSLLFVPNRELGTSTTAANSQKVARFTANPTTGQVIVTDGTTGGIKSSGYTIATSVPSGALFTDQNVRQSVTTTTDYRPIVTGAKNTTTIANLDDEITSTVYTSENFFVQPSTGSLYATQFFTKSYLSGTGVNVTSNGIYARSYFKRADNTVADYKEYLIRTYNGKITSNDGILVSVGGGGLTIVGGGESSSALAGLISDDQTKSDKTTLNVGGTLNTAIAGNSEQLIMSSDNNIYFLTNCQTIANRKPVCLDASSYFYPGTTNTGSIGTSSYKWASMYATTFYGALSGNASSSNYNVMRGITIKTGSSNQSHITLQTLMVWLITTKGYINSNTAQSLSIYTSWSYAENDILQLAIAGTNYELQLAGVIIEFDGYASDYQTGTFRLRIHSSPTISFTAASGYTQFPTSHIAEYTCNGSGYSPTWKMLIDLGDTIAIAHGGTGATTRLNALKNLTNENVGTNATYFLTITDSWGKGGYSSVANVKTVLGLGTAAYTSSTAYLSSSTKYAGSSSVGGAATNVATEVGSSAGARPVFYAYLGDNTRVVYNTNFTYNPSGGVLTATTFNGDLSGNATTASKLSNTSAIGSSTQPVYFNASGVPVACTQDANGARFSTVPFVRNDGVMEVGRYFDMHSTNTGTTDYDVRLEASGVSSFRFAFNTPASSSVAPSTNNQTSLGTSSLNWSSVYATNIYGTHNGKVMSSNIILRQHDHYQAGIGYDTKGNECIALWAKNTVTRLRWYAGTDMTTMTSGLMMDKTPDFEVSKADGSPRVYVGGFEIGVCYIMYDEASGTSTTVSNLNIPAGTKYFKIFIYDANTSGSNNVTNVIDIGVADGYYGGIISGGLQAQSFPCVITAVQFTVSTSNGLKSVTLRKSSSWTIGSSPSSGTHTLYIRKIIACT